MKAEMKLVNSDEVIVNIADIIEIKHNINQVIEYAEWSKKDNLKNIENNLFQIIDYAYEVNLTIENIIECHDGE